MRPSRVLVLFTAAAAASLVVSMSFLPNASASPTRAETPATSDAVGMYLVDGVATQAARDAVGRAGAAIVEVGAHDVVVSANAEVVARLAKLGYPVDDLQTGLPAKGTAPSAKAIDQRWHTYSEVVAAANAAQSAFPNLVRVFNAGTSYQGRQLIGVKISDNVATDESEPEVLFVHGQHAREHITVEMGLYVLNELTTKYATDATVKARVDSTELFVLLAMNPDGREYDLSGSDFRFWRKNRQPNSGSSAVGTDLNRNWGYRWGCCGGSSGSPSSETYRGRAAWSAPETTVVRNFTRSRVINGVQQIKIAVDWHSYSELVLWPYGYTRTDIPADMVARDHSVFVTMGQAMAQTNGYTPEQASDLYITDGSSDDWWYGEQRIFGFTFEMFPRTQSGGGFYPSYDVVPRETTRNRAAVMYMLQHAACPYEVIGETC
jgi:carboxypeptidase T